MRRGSYYNGFAPRDGQPRFPELWRGCVGAWAPCLGPSGLSLRDSSAFKNHGAFTNMTASANWAKFSGIDCLQFTAASSEVVNCGSSSVLQFATADNFSGCAWIYPTAFSSFNVIFGLRNSFNFRYSMRLSSGTINFLPTSGGSVSGSALSLNQWYHVGFVWQGGTVRVFVNGAETGSGTSRSLSNTLDFAIGNQGDLSQSFAGYIDDVRMYNRLLSGNEMQLLARRRGIAYEMEVPRRYTAQAAAAARARLLMLLGVGR